MMAQKSSLALISDHFLRAYIVIVGRDGCIKCGSISVSECSIWYVLASVFDISQHKTGKFAKITIVALGRVRVKTFTIALQHLCSR